MMTDLILLGIVMCMRITIGSEFNEKFDKIHDKIKFLEESFNQMSHLAEYYSVMELDNASENSFAFMVKTKIMNRIDEQASLKGKTLSNEERIKQFESRLEILYKTCK